MSLTVNVSSYISSLCYSVLRVEPYTSCSYSCMYCYAKWYRNTDIVKPNYDFISEFKRCVLKLRELKLKTIPFRMATLVDPFQPAEYKYRVSRYVLKICLENSIPLILNTKSIAYTWKAWFKLISELSSKGLLLLQVTIVTPSDKISRVVEPNTPTTSERLKAIEKTLSENIPVVVRYQPLIPGASDTDSVRDLFSQFKALGVKQVIVESIRCLEDDILFLKGVLESRDVYDSVWESYALEDGVEGRLRRPPLKWRLEIFKTIRDLAERFNIDFATCKEGLFNLHTAKNCCGIHLMNEGKYVLRPTLYEAWIIYRKTGKLPYYDEIISKYEGEKYIYGEKLKAYPRALRRGLKAHEKKLIKILIDEKTAKHIAPSLSLRGGI